MYIREGGCARDLRRTPQEPDTMQAARRHPFLTAVRRFCASFLCCHCVTDCRALSSTDHRSASAIQEDPEKREEEPKREETGKEKTDEEPEREETGKEPTGKEPTGKEPREKTDEEPEEKTDEEPEREETGKEPTGKEPTGTEPREKTDEEPEEKTDEEPKMEKTDEEPKTEKKDEEPILEPEERTAFFRCLEEDHVRMFLARDSCFKISDKYLLAMVLMYFRRANLRTKEYNIFFYPALFLANQFEEDETFRREIYPWALGPFWTMTKTWFLQLRNTLLVRMRFRSWIDRATCDLIMAQDPEHWAWRRERREHHSWAIRWYRRDPDEYTLKGPWRIPSSCSLCTIVHPSAGEENILCQTDTKEEPGPAEVHTCLFCGRQDGVCVCWIGFE